MILAAISVLVCGIIVAYSTPKIFYQLHKFQGWLVYLQAAKYGIYATFFWYYISEIHYAIAYNFITSEINIFSNPTQSLHSFYENLLTWRTPTTPIDFIYSYINSKIETANRIAKYDSLRSNYIFAVVLNSLISTVFLVQIIKKISFNLENQINEAVSVYSVAAPMDALVLRAALNYEYVLVTLDSEKCYVGLVSSIPLAIQEHSSGFQSLEIMMLYSGYRNNKKDFIKMNDYMEVYEEICINEEDDCENFELEEITDINFPTLDEDEELPLVTIPRDEIVSISKFDLTYYDSFEEKRLADQVDTT